MIKIVQLNDLDTLLKISKDTFFETFAKDNSIEDTEKYLKTHLNINKLKQELQNKNSKFYFCYHQSEVVGYLKVNINEAQTEPLLPDALEIERIYILNKFHGHGLGYLLMNKSIQIAKDLSIKEIWLGVWEHNIKALKFYNKLGFNQFSQHVFKLGEDEQIDLLLKKTI
jgi:ribosomal protein S18 acetylase RimI-like enzyme